MTRRGTPSLRWRGGPFAGQSENMEPVVLLSEDGTDRHRRQGTRTPRTPHLGFSCYAFDAATASSSHGAQQPSARSPASGPTRAADIRCPESRSRAVARRLDFELGLTPHALTLALPDFRYRASMNGVEENELCPVFLCRVLIPPLPNPDEVADFRWQAWPAYAQAAARAEPLPISLVVTTGTRPGAG